MAHCVPLINSLKSLSTIDSWMIVIIGFNDGETIFGKWLQTSESAKFSSLILWSRDATSAVRRFSRNNDNEGKCGRIRGYKSDAHPTKSQNVWKISFPRWGYAGKAGGRQSEIHKVFCRSFYPFRKTISSRIIFYSVSGGWNSLFVLELEPSQKVFVAFELKFH